MPARNARLGCRGGVGCGAVSHFRRADGGSADRRRLRAVVPVGALSRDRASVDGICYFPFRRLVGAGGRSCAGCHPFSRGANDIPPNDIHLDEETTNAVSQSVS